MGCRELKMRIERTDGFIEIVGNANNTNAIAVSGGASDAGGAERGLVVRGVEIGGAEVSAGITGSVRLA
jgi:hypothetical protein